MTATAEQYGFGARATYAQPRQSEYDMKERVRLSGLFPRVRNQPMSNQLQALMKEFDKNAALTGILERRRRQEERLQYELQGSEGMDALRRNLAPPFRAGLAGAATSATVADALARNRVAARVEDLVARRRAADVLAAAGNNQPGEIPVAEGLTLRPVASRTPQSMPATPSQRNLPATPRNTNRRSVSRTASRGSGMSRGSSMAPTDFGAMTEIE